MMLRDDLLFVPVFGVVAPIFFGVVLAGRSPTGTTRRVLNSIGRLVLGAVGHTASFWVLLGRPERTWDWAVLTIPTAVYAVFVLELIARQLTANRAPFPDELRSSSTSPYGPWPGRTAAKTLRRRGFDVVPLRPDPTAVKPPSPRDVGP